LVSDASEEELLAFAAALGLPRHWFQTRSAPHFDLSPAYRERALERGAIAVDWRGMVTVIRRLRARSKAPPVKSPAQLELLGTRVIPDPETQGL
jgi:hypothetical protein